MPPATLPSKKLLGNGELLVTLKPVGGAAPQVCGLPVLPLLADGSFVAGRQSRHGGAPTLPRGRSFENLNAQSPIICKGNLQILDYWK